MERSQNRYEKPSIADMAEGILRLLTGYTPDEQTSILNQLVKVTVLRRAEGLDIAAKHANQSSAELKELSLLVIHSGKIPERT
jgi:hypothetical protein